jgi:arylsulfatase A-like enzyme
VPGLAARRIAWPASGFDIAPTGLRAATGAAWPTPAMGQDLLTLVDTLADSADARAVFMENVPGTRGVRRHAAVRRGRWKYTAFLGTDVEELFDLAQDPGELSNLAGSQPRVLADMRRELQRLLSRRSCAIEALRER